MIFTTKNITAIIFCCFIFSCTKNKAKPNENSECLDIDESSMPILTWITKNNIQNKSPYFSPINNNCFVYNHINYSENKKTLIKYNLLTEEKEILVNDIKVITQPKWGNNNWITFDSYPDYHIWGVKNNGDSLTQFTTNEKNLYPTWDASGLFLYWQHSQNLGTPYYLKRLHQYDSIIDTIMTPNDDNLGFSSYNDINSDNILISSTIINGSTNVGFSDLSQFNFNSVVNNTHLELALLSGLCWDSNNHNFYFTISNKGLYSCDIITGDANLLLKFCDNFRYSNISCSKDGKILIGERIDKTFTTNSNGKFTGEIIEKSSIYTIDLTSLKQTKLKL